jgi:hypothetical protein
VATRRPGAVMLCGLQSRRRHVVRAAVPPRLPLASPPLALRRPPPAAVEILFPEANVRARATS